MRTLAMSLALIAGSAGAQTMYRCGNAFSQQPCGPNATEVATTGVQQPRMPSPNVPADAATVEAAKAICVGAVRQALKDPDTARLGAVERGQMMDLKTADQRSVPARVYTVSVNAKNSFGGYTGERPWVCFMDPSERAVLELVR